MSSRRVVPMMAWIAIVLAPALGSGVEHCAQEVPVQEAMKAAPAASTFAGATNLGAPVSREAELEDRVRQLEVMVNQLTVRMQSFSAAPATINAGAPVASGDAAPGVGNLATTIAPSRMGASRTRANRRRPSLPRPRNTTAQRPWRRTSPTSSSAQASRFDPTTMDISSRFTTTRSLNTGATRRPITRPSATAS